MESTTSTPITLNEEQQKKYDQVVELCPTAVNRDSYNIVWITKEPYSAENSIYMKLFTDKGFKQPIPVADVTSFLKYAKSNFS